jgi:multidrug efflux system outer membrane protein
MKKYLLLCVLLSGCSLWTNYEKPETPTPESWQGDAAKAAPAKWPDADWWKQFNSAALTQQIEAANIENLDIKAAVARVQQADAQAKIAGAALLPSVDATAGASHNRSNGVSTGTGTIKPRLSNAYNANVSAAYELDFWGKNWATQEAAEALADASRFDQETVHLTTISSVANSYFDTLATQERLTIAKSNLENAQKLLDTFQKRFTQGVATALDVAQQQSVVDTQRAAIPPLELRLKQDLDARAILLGKLPEAMTAPEEKLADIAVPAIVAGLPSELLQRRPDVQNAEAQLISANANITVARAQFFPSIQLTASAGYASPALSQLFRPDSMLFALAGSATQPIFEGGLLEGQLELAHAKYDELLQDYHKSVLSAFSDVEDSLSAVEQDEVEEKAQSEAVVNAQKAYDLSLQQLGGGIVDITSVLNTQRTLFSAQDAYAQARLAHLQAMVGLYNALGGGWNSSAAAPPVAPEAAPVEKPETAPAVETLPAPAASTPDTGAVEKPAAPATSPAADTEKQETAPVETPATAPSDKPENKPAPAPDAPAEPKPLIVPTPSTTLPLPAPDPII